MPWGKELTLDQVVATFHGAKRRLYQEARSTFLTRPLCESDGRINSFVKAEKTNPNAKVNPDPRMIQARSPRYNLQIAKYLRFVEHQIYNLEHHGTRAVAKGLNQKSRAEHIIRKFERFEHCVCFSVDCSRFDQHEALEVLKVEHDFYRSFYPHSEELNWLLKMQERNKCRTKNGVKYSVRGGRMSGDINTALGNCLVMILMVRAAFDELAVKYDLFDDGDDCLLFVEEQDFGRVRDALPAIFLRFGQELRVENIARDIPDVLFCQSRIVWNGEHHVMMRDWRKVLSQACCGTKYWNMPNMVRPMMGLIAVCESNLCAGIPILAKFAEAVRRNSEGQCAVWNAAESGLVYRVRLEFGDETPTYKSSTVTTRARLSFQRTWGVDVWEQKAIEERLDRWVLGSTEAVLVAQELAADWQPNYHPIAYRPELL